MNLDSFFEDVEAQIDAETESATAQPPLDSTNLVRVYWQAGGYAELVAVLLGQDFVAGMALGSNDWRLIRLDAILRMEFQELKGLDIPKLRFFEGTRREFLERLPLPLSITWSLSARADKSRGILVDLVGDFFLVAVIGSETPVGIPLASVDTFGIDSVENFNEFS